VGGAGLAVEATVVVTVSIAAERFGAVLVIER